MDKSVDTSSESSNSSPEFPAIDGITILAELGRGASSIVYRGVETVLDRIVAVKVLSTTIDTTLAKRFRTEARLLAALRHPNVVNVYQYGVTNDGRPYLSMELVSGQPLDERLSSGSLGTEEFKIIFSGVLDALELAHSKQIIHRDIKPSNIVICQDSTLVCAKLLDFGIAKLRDLEERTLTADGTVVGSPSYISPEQVCGREVDARTDLYSLGCVMYEALSGTPPFKGTTPMEVMYQHVNAKRPGPESLFHSGGSKQLIDLVLTLLSVDPKSRPGSALELKEKMITACQSSTLASRGRAGARATRALAVALLMVSAFLMFVVKSESGDGRRKESSAGGSTFLSPVQHSHNFRPQRRNSEIDAANLAMHYGHYDEAINKWRKLMSCEFPSMAEKASIFLNLSNCYSYKALLSKDPVEIRKLYSESRKVLETSMRELEQNDSVLLDGSVALAGAISQYLIVISQSSGIAKADEKYKQLMLSAPYASNSIRNRHLLAGHVVYLTAINQLALCQKEYEALLKTDLEHYGWGLSTINDALMAHNVDVMLGDSEPRRWEKLLLRVLYGSSALSASNRNAIVCTFSNQLVVARRFEVARQLLNHELQKQDDYCYRRDHVGTLYAMLARLCFAENKTQEGLGWIDKAIKCTDSPDLVADWRELQMQHK